MKKLTRTNSMILELLALFLVSLVFIIGGSYFSSPPLRSDDWNWIAWPAVFDPLKAINLTDRRPFFPLLLSLLNLIFGTQIQLYYVINWGLLLISAVVVYFIIKAAFPDKSWLALPVALITLIYPVNYARTWLVILNNTYSLLLSLLCILLLVIYRSSGKTFQLVLANFLFLISLLTYEAGFGLVVLTALFLIIFTHNKRKWSFLSILITAVFFLMWRYLIQPQLFSVQDFYLQSVNFNIKSILQRYIQGLFIFIFNWVGPLLIGFGDYKYWVFLVIAAIAIIGLALIIGARVRNLKRRDPEQLTEKIRNIKSVMGITLAGGLFWLAGYIPVILLWQPAFYGDSSRVNFAAIPGAALVVVSSLSSLFFFFAKGSKFQPRKLYYVIIPLVLMGMVYQVHSQNQRIKVWETNKQLWQDMFIKVPNLERGTKMVIVVPGYQELKPFEMLPFRGDWEAESALDILYNDSDLFAEYYYIDNPNMADNWIPVSGNYANYLFVFFDPSTGKLSIIQDPVTALSLSVEMEGYDPGQRIIKITPNTGEYRGLVD